MQWAVSLGLVVVMALSSRPPFVIESHHESRSRNDIRFCFYLHGFPPSDLRAGQQHRPTTYSNLHCATNHSRRYHRGTPGPAYYSTMCNVQCDVRNREEARRKGQEAIQHSIASPACASHDDACKAKREAVCRKRGRRTRGEGDSRDF
jgi:hypothetical protein